jgi:hypothetical protein
MSAVSLATSSWNAVCRFQRRSWHFSSSQKLTFCYERKLCANGGGLDRFCTKEFPKKTELALGMTDDVLDSATSALTQG